MNRRRAIATGAAFILSRFGVSAARSAESDPRVADFVKAGKIEQVSRRPPSYPPRTLRPVSYGAWP